MSKIFGVSSVAIDLARVLRAAFEPRRLANFVLLVMLFQIVVGHKTRLSVMQRYNFFSIAQKLFVILRSYLGYRL